MFVKQASKKLTQRSSKLTIWKKDPSVLWELQTKKMVNNSIFKKFKLEIEKNSEGRFHLAGMEMDRLAAILMAHSVETIKSM
jgi:hypothetical protein